MMSCTTMKVRGCPKGTRRIVLIIALSCALYILSIGPMTMLMNHREGGEAFLSGLYAPLRMFEGTRVGDLIERYVELFLPARLPALNMELILRHFPGASVSWEGDLS